MKVGKNLFYFDVNVNVVKSFLLFHLLRCSYIFCLFNQKLLSFISKKKLIWTKILEFANTALSLLTAPALENYFNKLTRHYIFCPYGTYKFSVTFIWWYGLNISNIVLIGTKAPNNIYNCYISSVIY